MRVLAVIVLTMITLGCVGTLAHASMATMSGQDCFGPGCEQQVTCAGPDQAGSLSRPLAAQPTTIASAPIELSPPPSQAMPAAPMLDAPNHRAVCPLVPRSPPAN